mmetsp:Transcript_1216/g.5266  ORF Transcript_1216/g.5266 Transcript_1216/m.5266 type:complete len:257 (+) Transcript_1216:1699-2469(+)
MGHDVDRVGARGWFGRTRRRAAGGKPGPGLGPPRKGRPRLRRSLRRSLRTRTGRLADRTRGGVVARRATRGARGAVLTRHRRPPRRVHRRLPPLERLHRVHVLRAGQGLGRAPRGFDCRSTRRRLLRESSLVLRPRQLLRPGALLHSLRGRRRFLPVVGSARQRAFGVRPGRGEHGRDGRVVVLDRGLGRILLPVCEAVLVLVLLGDNLRDGLLVVPLGTHALLGAAHRAPLRRRVAKGEVMPPRPLQLLHRDFLI